MFCFSLIVYAEEKVKTTIEKFLAVYEFARKNERAGSVFNPLSMSSVANFSLAVPLLLTS